MVYASSIIEANDELLSRAFPVLIDQLMKTEDNDMLNEGSACLSAYLSRAASQILQWNDAKSTGIGYILNFVGRLLQPSIPDMAALRVGSLVTKVINKLGSHLGAATLKDMLKAVLARLQTKSIPSLIQSLVLIFVRLMIGGVVPGIGSQALTKDIYEFLNSLKMSENTTALQFVLQLWAKHHDDFHGTLNIKASTLGLLNLFCMQNQQLLSLPVEGDVIVQANQGRSTRSKSKQSGQPAEVRATIPLAVKALTVAVRELMVIAEQKDAPADDEDSSESEEEEIQDEMKTLLDLVGIPGEDSWLSDPLDMDDEEEEDPDCVNDPLYTLDLQTFLEGFLFSFATQQRDAFGVVADCLPDLEKKFLIELLQRIAITKKE
jgi:hypothetical protein